MKKLISRSFFGILLLTALVLTGCSAGGGATGGSGGGAESSSKEITSFSFTQAANSTVLTANAVGTIDESSSVPLTITIPYGTNVSALKATFTTTGESVSIGSIVQTSGVTPNNFSGIADLIYTVNAEDGSTYNYIVHLSVGNYIFQLGSLFFQHLLKAE